MKLAVVLSLVAASLCSLASQAGGISLGQAANYNMFVKENFSASSSDTEGAAAIGGNLLVNGGYDFGYVNSSAPATVTVGGNVVKSGWGHLNVYDGAGNSSHGDLVYGGSYTVSQGGVDAASKTKAPSSVDFNSAFNHLNKLSDELAAKTTPAVGVNPNTQDGVLVFTPAKVTADNVYVFNITQDDLNQFHTIRVDNANISKDALIVFNMSNPNGTQAKNWTPQEKCAAGQKDCMSLTQVRYEVGDLNSNSPAIANHVLFNFNGINDLRISSSVYGSILAPKAAVSTEWGVIWGQVMAKSWSGNQQVNWSPLDIPPGGNTSVSAPAPTALLLLLPALFWFRRRSTALLPQGAMAS
ncbi:MAG: choice-of-anchor A family protein [Rheinheimera sp.]|nr:choice-of-anchor A family protein [Rheinheimera sp.]